MSDEATVVDAEVIADEPVAASTAVVQRERRREVLRPLDVDQLLSSFASYQEMLPKLLAESDYQGTGGERFVKKSGWRKIARAFDLDVAVIPGMNRIERDESGQPIRAEVWMRATAPSGASFDADGYCSIDEARFGRAGGRQKIENDLRTTATTRATNRAISGLVGMGAVSAEEVDAGSGPTYGPRAPDRQIESTRLAIAYLLGGSDPNATEVHEVMKGIAQECTYHPLAVMVGIVRVAKALQAKRQQEQA